MLTSKQVAIVLASFQCGTTKKEFCAQHGISRSTLYRWRRLLLAILSTLSMSERRRPRAKASMKTRKYRCRIR